MCLIGQLIKTNWMIFEDNQFMSKCIFHIYIKSPSTHVLICSPHVGLFQSCAITGLIFVQFDQDAIILNTFNAFKLHLYIRPL